MFESIVLTLAVGMFIAGIMGGVMAAIMQLGDDWFQPLGFSLMMTLFLVLIFGLGAGNWDLTPGAVALMPGYVLGYYVYRLGRWAFSR